MKKTICALVLGALSLCAVMSASGVGRADPPMPRGTYRQTCHSIRMERGTLYAKCQDSRGRFRDAHLDRARSCRGDIRNHDGRLRCG